MSITPSMITFAPNIIRFFLRLPFSAKFKEGLSAHHVKEENNLKDHIVIIGYGVNGNNLARASSTAEIPYVIIEMNPETVRREKFNKQPIFFGDATHDNVLHHANIRHAHAAAIMINDPPAARRIVQAIRKINPSIYLIVRTRYQLETEQMYHLGANEVVPDEIGTSIEIFARTLKQFNVPKEKIRELIVDMHAGYELIKYFD